MFESQIRKWDPIAGVSLFAVMVIAAISVQLSNWTFNLTIVTQTCIYALLAGFLIGYSKFNRTAASILLMLYGVAFFFLLFMFSLSDDPSWIVRVNELLGRYQSVFFQIRSKVPLDDGILFLTAMVVLFLIKCLAAGYLFSRNQRPYFPLVVTLVTFFTVQFFLSDAFRNPLLIFLFTFFLVLLVGRLNYLHRKERWTKEHFHQDRKAPWTFLIISIIAAGTIATVLFATPIVYERMGGNSDQTSESPRLFSSRSREWLSNLLNPLKPTKSFGEGIFTGILPVGERRSTGDEVIFEVQKPASKTSYGRFYWYAHVYSEYQNAAWENKGIQKDIPSAIPAPGGSLNSEMDQDFRFTYIMENLDLVFPQIFGGVERDIDIAFFDTGDPSPDILYLVNYDRIRRGENIVVEGGYYDFYLENETEISAEYPTWVLEKYLQLPEDFPSSIRFLAESVTRQEKSTTQKILALTEYLRSKYAYSDVVDVPAESDPIVWFLFEGKEGFCNYYASAEVLMLRSLGIPARMAVGYAQGDYSNDKNAYQVRARDSHAWVEVFYPEVGWVIFEPTPSQPAIVYRESRSGTVDETIDLTNGGQAESTEEEFSEAARDPEIGLVIDAPISSGNGILNRRNLINASGLAFSIAVFIFALRGFILRKKAIQLPISVQKFLQDREVKIPKFVQKWAEYERLPPIVKNYRILKLLTIKLKLMPTENFTPREFMSALNRIVRVDSRTGRMFIDWLDESLYGRSIGKYTAGMRHTFKGYLKLLGREWISRVLGSLKFKRTDQTNQ